MGETINQRLARLLTENSSLPIKVRVNVELALAGDIDDWCIGELVGCEVTEYVNYGSDEWFFVGRDNEALFERMRDDIWCDKRLEIYVSLAHISDWFKLSEMADKMANEALPDEKLDTMAREAIDELDWKPCILLEVGP